MSNPRTLARRALGPTDLVVGTASVTDYLDDLRDHRDAAVAHVDEDEQRRHTRAQVRITDLTLELGELDGTYQERTRDLQQRRDNMLLWRQVGAAARFSSTPIPRLAHAPLLLALALLDAYVFSRAAAVALDVEVSLSDPGYWVGGSFGLVAFLCGVLLARSLKQARLAAVQRDLLTRVPHTVPAGAHASLSHVSEVVTTGILFVLFSAAGTLVRMEVNTAERESVLLLQLLVPVIVVAVEYFVFDPTNVRVPRRSRRHRALERRLAAAQAAEANATQLAAERRTAVQADYKAASAVIRRRLDALGYR